ncbi:retrovirus-related Pol polyprotein from transposon 297 [Nephila pilipes]|uniref:RNA-directed DNA polymerase n=1 Tax=Nephila pilipes TaxID=299642 RepID=A0A8X6MLZ6_NEPPI|nr:retrovirus-related Pol polyprotein from transposon 297 [Nephila pilipes]
MFQRFEEYGVVQNASKTVQGETLVKLFGHKVTAEGIPAIPEKVAAIMNFPKAETVKELRRFLAICNFFRREIFNKLNAFSHSGIRASLKLVVERYVWLSMRHGVTLWARTCLQCQRAKVPWHTRSERGKLETPNSRFHW